MKTPNLVEQAVDEFGREARLEKKSHTWYRRSAEVIAVLNLQKSQYGPQYYVNQAFWLRQLGDEPYPKEHECHVRSRLEDIVPEAEGDIQRLLDLEQPVPDAQRTAGLRQLLGDRLLPVIERAGSVAGLRSLRDEGALEGAAVAAPAQRVLDAVSN